MKQQRLRYVNLDYLNQMSAGDLGTKKLLLEMLMKELPVAVTNMQSFYKKQQWKQLHETSHKMKSTLAFVGNNEMTKANLVILEQVQLSKNLSQLSTYLQLLTNKSSLVQKELEKIYQSLSK